MRERLHERVRIVQAKQGRLHWMERRRFLDDYQASGGYPNLKDPKLLMAEAKPVYGHWKTAKKIGQSLPVPRF
jgi:hypothetical protein